MAQKTYHWYEGYEREWDYDLHVYEASSETLGMGGITTEYYTAYRADGMVDLDIESIEGDPDGIVVMPWLTARIFPAPMLVTQEHPKGYGPEAGGVFFYNFGGPAGYPTEEWWSYGEGSRGGFGIDGSKELAPKPYPSEGSVDALNAWRAGSWEYTHFRRVLDPYSISGVAFGYGDEENATFFHGPPTPSFPGGWPQWADDFLDPSRGDYVRADNPTRYAITPPWPAQMGLQWDFNAIFALLNYRGFGFGAEIVTSKVYLFPFWWGGDPDFVPPGRVTLGQGAGGHRRLGRVIGGAAEGI